MSKQIAVVLGAVGIIKGSLPQGGPALVEITKEINPYLTKHNFLKNAPFGLLSGIVRYGTKFDPFAEVGPIDKRNGELPFAVEVNLSTLKGASRDEIKARFLDAVVPALDAIASNYDLPRRGLAEFAVAHRVPWPPKDQIESEEANS